MFRVILFATILLNFITVSNTNGQGKALGQWRSHLPYSRPVCGATDGNKIFVATQSSFFTYNILKDEIQTYSKVNGMSDIEMAYVGYDDISGTAILAYNNSNIDLFENETFYNIPELKLRSTSGDKKIYHIFIESGLAYLSTGVGIIVLNLEKKEVKETYVFTKNKASFAVKGMSSNDGFFFAVTDNGLYRTSKKNANIQASSSWTLLDSSRKYLNVSVAGGTAIVATKDSVFAIQSDTAKFVFRSDSSTIRHLDPVENGVAIAVHHTNKNFGEIYSLNNTLNIIDSFDAPNPYQSVQTSDKRIWVSDLDRGFHTPSKVIVPNGPFNVGAYDIIAENGKVYVAHGSYDDRWNIAVNRAGFSILDNNSWTFYNTYTSGDFENLKDAIRLAIDPRDKTLYIASQTDGLFFMKENKTVGSFREDVFEPHNVDPTTIRISGVAFDKDNNLWVTQSNAQHELMARSASDGKWYKFGLPAVRPNMDNVAAGLIIDDYNQQWFFSPAGGGVLVYNTNGTFENTSDDKYVKLLKGQGSGNLPENFVQCIVNDKKGTIWIGTTNGIGIVNCPDRVTDLTCEAEIRVVQYDQFAGQLFAGENVTTIAVDGANRKWIGTGNGVWLISEDANKIISRFTVENSPLPSNFIQTIKVDPITGDVYFGTDKGLVSYRGTATDGASANENVVIFPNPVKNDYSGNIAIKGLVDNADVRITDISGQLIYKTKAFGGQAVWNGKDYTGRRPQSGVFLVFATNSTGTETFAGKMVFIK